LVPYAAVAATGGLLTAWNLGVVGGHEGLQLLARHTARVSFVTFLVVFCAGPLAVLVRTPATLWAVRNRRHLGLAFALAHFIHLGALVSFFAWTPATPAPIAIAFGGFGYVVVTAMALTSNDRAVRLLGRGWKRLHGFGVWYLWFIFTQSYAMRLAATSGDEAAAPSDTIVYVVLLALALAALGLRVARALRARGRRPAAPARRSER
jgi:DMSO/TMAO reductase YedYZ heme-binding membrane subunit